MSTPDSGEVHVIHRLEPGQQLPPPGIQAKMLERMMKRRGPAPELGKLLCQPQMLAATSQAAIGLRGVYGYSWGLDLVFKAARRTWEMREMPYDPLEGLRLGLAVSEQELVLHGLPPGPQDASISWMVALGSGGGRPGYEYVGQIEPMVMPYPATGSLWIGWSWPEFGLDENSVEITLPEPGSFDPVVMLGT